MKDSPNVNIYRVIRCEKCGADIDVEELADGTLLVHCPNCTGECFTCQCHLVQTCFSRDDRVRVRHPTNGGE